MKILGSNQLAGNSSGRKILDWKRAHVKSGQAFSLELCSRAKFLISSSGAASSKIRSLRLHSPVRRLRGKAYSRGYVSYTPRRSKHIPCLFPASNPLSPSRRLQWRPPHFASLPRSRPPPSSPFQASSPSMPSSEGHQVRVLSGCIP